MRFSWFAAGFSGLVDLLLPLRCAGCGTPGVAWCSGCAGELGGLRRVERPLLDPALPVYALGRYRGAARRAVLAYKESGYRHLADPLARHLAIGLRAITAEHGFDRSWWLIPAPSKAIASRRRGGPHMSRLARRAAAELTSTGHRAAVADCLVTARGAADSTGLDEAERVRNLSGRLLLQGRLPPSGAQVVLIDDVITTAATVAGCLATLEAAGVGVTAVLSLTATAG